MKRFCFVAVINRENTVLEYGRVKTLPYNQHFHIKVKP